jgi:hypothetical protein
MTSTRILPEGRSLPVLINCAWTVPHAPLYRSPALTAGPRDTSGSQFLVDCVYALPLDHLAENATFVETSRPSSRQTAAKNLIVLGVLASLADKQIKSAD